MKKIWKPKYGDDYFCIYGTYVSELEWDYSYEDDGEYAIGNCFKTKKEAQFTIERLKVIKEMKDFAMVNNDKIVWKDLKQRKCYIGWDFACNDFWFGYGNIKDNNIYFTSIEVAKGCIEKVGADRIIKYYLEVEKLQS